MEHSDRGRYVTDQVSVWICNDGKYITAARRLARIGVEVLSAYLTRVITTDDPYSSPWQVAQELAPNDFNRVDWQSVANDLLQED